MTYEQQLEFLTALNDLFHTDRISADMFLNLRAVLIDRPDDYVESIYWALYPPDIHRFVRFSRRFGKHPTFADGMALLAEEQRRSSIGITELNPTKGSNEAA